MKNNKIPSASESQEQIALFQWARLQEGKYPELKLLFHIPNEGKRSHIIGAKMKAEGLRAGVPDIMLPVARDNYHGLFIEMKANNGKLSDMQASWLASLCVQNYRAVVCVGFESATREIVRYLKGGCEAHERT